MITFEPPEAAIPEKPVPITVAFPIISIPATVLLLKLILLPAPERYPIIDPLLAVEVILITPLAVVDPIILPVTVPTFTFPFAILIPKILLPVKPPEMSKFVMVLFCTEEGTANPNDNSMRLIVYKVVPVLVIL